MNKLNIKNFLAIFVLVLLAFLFFTNRYEYTKYPNGRIYQRVDKLTSNVEILCCDCRNQCKWRQGNQCPHPTRQGNINYGIFHNKSIAEINGALDKNCFYSLSSMEIELIEKKKK